MAVKRRGERWESERVSPRRSTRYSRAPNWSPTDSDRTDTPHQPSRITSNRYAMMERLRILHWLEEDALASRSKIEAGRCRENPPSHRRMGIEGKLSPQKKLPSCRRVAMWSVR